MEIDNDPVLFDQVPCNDFQWSNPIKFKNRVEAETKNGKRKHGAGSSSIPGYDFITNRYVINDENAKRVGGVKQVSFLNTSSSNDISHSDSIEVSDNQSKKPPPNSSLVLPVAVDSIDKNVVFNCDNFEQCNSDSSVDSLSSITNPTYIDTMANVPELHAVHEHLEMVQLAQDRGELLRLQEAIENAELDASFKSESVVDPPRDSSEDARPSSSSALLHSSSSNETHRSIPISGIKSVLHHQIAAVAKKRKRFSRKQKEKVNTARVIESSYDEWESGALLRERVDVSDEPEEYFTSEIQAAIIYEAKELVNDALKAEAAKEEVRRQEEWKENKSSKPDPVHHVFTLSSPKTGKEHRAAKRAYRELEEAISKALNPDSDPYYLCFEANFSKDTEARVLNAESKQYLFKLQETRSALDSGATINIGEVDTYLKDFSTKGRIPIQSFSGKVSWSLGCGTSFGHCVDINNKKIDLIIPQMHDIGGGSDHDLLSISRFLDAKFSFHLTPTSSTMVTPEGNIINLERSGGLIFLKWFKTVKTDCINKNDKDFISQPYHKSQAALFTEEFDSPNFSDVISEATSSSDTSDSSAVPTTRTSPTESCCYLQMLETTKDILKSSIEASTLRPLPSLVGKSVASTEMEVQHLQTESLDTDNATVVTSQQREHFCQPHGSSIPVDLAIQSTHQCSNVNMVA